MASVASHTTLTKQETQSGWEQTAHLSDVHRNVHRFDIIRVLLWDLDGGGRRDLRRGGRG